MINSPAYQQYETSGCSYEFDPQVNFSQVNTQTLFFFSFLVLFQFSLCEVSSKEQSYLFVKQMCLDLFASKSEFLLRNYVICSFIWFWLLTPFPPSVSRRSKTTWKRHKLAAVIFMFRGSGKEEVGS